LLGVLAVCVDVIGDACRPPHVTIKPGGRVVPIMPNAPKAGTVQITMRISTELSARAELMAARIRAEHPGLEVGRTDAIRSILEKHLPPLEQPSEVGTSSGPKSSKPSSDNPTGPKPSRKNKRSRQ
jgi:hypothetical protein